jgi:hypothetical protein
MQNGFLIVKNPVFDMINIEQADSHKHKFTDILSKNEHILEN